MIKNNYNYCKQVKITVDAYSSCLNHSLLTESEEVMGLLLGNVEETKDGNIINIFSTICLTRKCKAKDRVEFDEIQISKACEIGDALGRELKIDVNVVGWYHSHPKITIPPSQVDLSTQFSQQYQGPFVGLIISCFSNDSTNTNKIKLTAFQSKKEENKNCYIPTYINIEFISENEVFLDVNSNTANSALTFCNILRNLLQEEEDQNKKESSKLEDDDYLNKSIIFCNRNILYSKFIQTVSTPYVTSVYSEIENLKNFIDYVKDMNKKLNNAIKNYKDINKFKDE
jgi:proteasome lid subunit RPN8/RPN11